MKVIHDKEQSQFIALDDNGMKMGHLIYSERGAILRANSTRTEDQFRGHGVAASLVDAIVSYARAEGKKISPVCSYVEAVFTRNPERYKDVATA